MEEVGWGLLILAAGAGLCYISWHALFRTEQFIDRMNQTAYGTLMPKKDRRGKRRGHRAFTRIFAGGITLFLATACFIAAAQSFASAMR